MTTGIVFTKQFGEHILPHLVVKNGLKNFIFERGEIGVSIKTYKKKEEIRKENG